MDAGNGDFRERSSASGRPSWVEIRRAIRRPAMYAYLHSYSIAVRQLSAPHEDWGGGLLDCHCYQRPHY